MIAPKAAARPYLALLTDFGLKEPYVGQLKAAVHNQCPDVLIVDISHEVPAFNVRTAAYFLAASMPYFPPGTVFLTVVDPGVGSERKIVALKNGTHTFIAPNNGVLSLIKQGPEATLWHIAQAKTQAGSATFAGRDFLAPLAGRLLSGESLAALADPIPLAKLYSECWSLADIGPNTVNLEILHVDHFGNVILNLACKQMEAIISSYKMGNAGNMFCKFRGKEYPLLNAAYYSQIPPHALALIPGSQGYMELAMNCGSAAYFLNIEPDFSKASAGDLKISLLY